MLKAVTNLVNVSQITGVLPVVNGGTGVTTSTGTGNVVLSAAPTLSGDVSLSTGNLVISTSGKGIDFSATSGTGTSELFNDYEEGTYTPTVTASSGTLTTVTATGNYTKIGRQVTANMSITLTNIGTASGALYATLPFTAGLFPSVGAGREDNTTGFELQVRIQSSLPTTAVILTYANLTAIGTGNVVFGTITYFV